MKRFWVSFNLRSSLAKFEYHGPWWISGHSCGPYGDDPNVCLAVCANDDAHAREVVLAQFDEPPDIADWRFVIECETDWEPFRDRFQRKDWMHWPLTPARAAELRRKETT